jgi:pyruvate kinase
MESIQMMNAVIQEAEKSLVNTHNDFSNGCLTLRDREKKSLIKHSLMIADELQAQAIIIMTKAGILARLAAAFRPNINIYAFTKNRTTFNFMNILY